jgi:hypothetical protein
MKYLRPVLAILAATIWISLSEFFRNQILLKNYWTDHYQSMGLTFPAEPVNGAVWGLWSLFFAITIFFLSGKFNLLWTFIFSWFVGFVLMWVVIGNLGVLPLGILPYAIPLSLLEAFVAVWITRRII